MIPPGIQRYVAMGDSLSEGFSDWGRADRSIGFASILAGLLREQAPELEWTNLGRAGARTADLLHGQLPRALQLAPDFVTVVVGANDVPGTPEQQFQHDYNNLLEQLRAGIGGTIVVANLPDFAHLLPAQFASYQLRVRARVQSFNRIIAEAAVAHDTLLVDLHTSSEAEDPRNLSGDGVHPNARGYRAMARAFVETLNYAGFALPLPPLD